MLQRCSQATLIQRASTLIAQAAIHAVPDFPRESVGVDLFLFGPLAWHLLWRLCFAVPLSCLFRVHSYVVFPLFDAWSKIVPEVSICLKTMEESKKLWQNYQSQSDL